MERRDTEEAGKRGRMVQIIGDGVNGDWLTWCWNDPDRPVGVYRVEELWKLVAASRSALPREPNSDKGKSPCDLEWLMTFKTVGRQNELKGLGLHDPLTCRDDELELMRVLSRALLPDDLRRQLIEAAADGECMEVRVAPNPPAAIVSWRLLVLDDNDMRSLDVADVSWIAPILPRDIDPDVPCIIPATGGRALYAVDPKTSKGRVLPEASESCGCHGHGAEQFSAEYNDLEKLWARLKAGAGKITRLLMVGHCATGTGDAADTVLFTGDDEANKL